MLNDYLIARDVVGFVTRYVENTPADQAKFGDSFKVHLRALAQKQHMSYAEWWGLLEELDRVADEPALGLRIGASVKAEHCGVLGYLFRTSRNMADALTCYRRFERLLYAGSQAEIQQTDSGGVTLRWDPANGYSSLLSDALLLAGIVSVSRDILQPLAFNPVAVNFTHPIPKQDQVIYEEFFSCEVQDAQPSLSITFRLEDLLAPISHQDYALHTLLGKQAEEQLKQAPENDVFTVKLQDTIMRCLHEGRPDVDAVAGAMNISARTLHRRLKERGRVFRDVLRDIRKSMSERYLKDDKLTLSETALLLGYHDQSAFTRAFKQWFGVSPLQFKKSMNPHSAS